MAATESDKTRTEIAVIGGSQAYDLLQSRAVRGERLDRIDTPYGSSQPLYRVETPTSSFYFLSRHGEKSYSIGAPFVN